MPKKSDSPFFDVRFSIREDCDIWHTCWSKCHFRIINQIWGRSFESFNTRFFRNPRSWLTVFWGQSRFWPDINLKTWIRADFEIMVGLWRISASLKLEFKQSWGRDFTKRRILARNGPEYVGRGTKKISPRRISGADILSVTLELRRI